MAGSSKKESSTEPNNKEMFNRTQVLKNTELNAQLGIEGEKIREQIRAQNSAHENGGSGPKTKYPKTKAPTALKSNDLSENEGFANFKGVGFDESGINEWDRHRGQTEKITEPNTPYMGTAVDTEYYDDDPVPEDIDLSSAV